MPELPPDLNDLVLRALAEDLGQGDVTSEAVIPAAAEARGELTAKASGVVAGLPVAERAFALVPDPPWSRAMIHRDGDRVEPGTLLGTITGSARGLLAGERVALNFLTHLSGIATLTRAFVDACAGTESTILCTRKTLPGLRALERYAVEVGGAELHRAGLNDAVLIKDNHVAVAGGVGPAVRAAKESSVAMPVEVEVESLDQLREAIDAGADAILLDNPDLELVKRAVDVVGDRVPLEVSGGMTLERVRDVAGLGGLRISVGRITHSAPALDISLEVRTAGFGA